MKTCAWVWIGRLWRLRSKSCAGGVWIEDLTLGGPFRDPQTHDSPDLDSSHGFCHAQHVITMWHHCMMISFRMILARVNGG
jgi:hypothetical protein